MMMYDYVWWYTYERIFKWLIFRLAFFLLPQGYELWPIPNLTRLRRDVDLPHAPGVQLRGTAVRLRSVTRLATTAAAEDEKGVITWGWLVGQGRISQRWWKKTEMLDGIGWYWMVLDRNKHPIVINRGFEHLLSCAFIFPLSTIRLQHFFHTKTFSETWPLQKKELPAFTTQHGAKVARPGGCEVGAHAAPAGFLQVQGKQT